MWQACAREMEEKEEERGQGSERGPRLCWLRGKKEKKEEGRAGEEMGWARVEGKRKKKKGPSGLG